MRRTEHGAQINSFIGGDWVSGTGAEVEVHNPANTTELVSQYQKAEEAALERATECARAALAEWGKVGLIARSRFLLRAADEMESLSEDLAETLTREEGKTFAESRGEALRSARILRFFAAEAEQAVGEVFASSNPDETVYTVHRPVGVVGAITPWNFPVLIPVWKIAPALVYGNTVVWKPSGAVPAVSALIVEAFDRAGLPPGVLNMVLSSGAVAETLVTQSRVDAVSFTGSTPVGRHLISLAGGAGMPVQCEMGGKNAAIVLPDSPMEAVARDVVRASMGGTGQKCTAASRLLVHEAVRDELLGELSRALDDWVVGNGMDAGVDMGPLVSAQALQSVRHALDESLDRGDVEVLAGGDSHRAASLGNGHYMAPYVVALQRDDAVIWKEELFGPVLVERPFSTWEEAVSLANDGQYGLTASIYTGRLDIARRAVHDLDVGIVHINSQTAGSEPHVPFGGDKQSGYGPKEQGRYAREFFTKARTVYELPIRD